MNTNKSSLSTTFYDPEAEPMSEIETEPETETETEQTPEKPKPKPKKRAAPRQRKKKRKSIQWFTVWRSGFWAFVSVLAVSALFQGVEGYLGQSAAYITLSVSVLVASFLLDRDWKKMRKK